METATELKLRQIKNELADLSPKRRKLVRELKATNDRIDELLRDHRKLSQEQASSSAIKVASKSKEEQLLEMVKNLKERDLTSLLEQFGETR